MAILPDNISFGPFNIPGPWLALVIALSTVMWTLRRTLRSRGLDAEKHLDWVMYGMIIAVVLYKFIPVVLDPTLIVTNPRGVLLGVGPDYAFWLAIVIGVLYYIVRVLRSGVPTTKWLDAWIIPIVSAIVVYSLVVADFGQQTSAPWGAVIEGVKYHPINLYRAIGWGLVGWLVVRNVASSRHRLALSVFSLPAVELVVSWFQSQPKLVAGFTWMQWLNVALLAVGLMLYWRLPLSQIQVESAEQGRVE